MPLQIDATLLYGQPKGPSPTALRDVDTPYNTYMHLGLPPTPIANPGRASIQAALNPAPNPAPGDPICLDLKRSAEREPEPPCVYLYYVLANENGGHAFAASLEQHEANVHAARSRPRAALMITGATRLAAVIGSPVRHTLSPVLHNAAFESAGLDWRMVAFEVAPGHGAAAVPAMRTLGIGGLAVTTPHKADVAAAVDEVDPAAHALRSVNTVVLRDDGSTLGASTDGAGFVDSLRENGVDVERARVVVLGAGGAARSIVDALGRAGVVEIVIVNRNPEHAAAAAALARGGTSRNGGRHRGHRPAGERHLGRDGQRRVPGRSFSSPG